jgi:hypothetical protein
MIGVINNIGFITLGTYEFIKFSISSASIGMFPIKLKGVPFS